MLRAVAIVVLALSAGVETPVQSIPAGAQLDLLLAKELDAGAIRIDEKFDATLLLPISMGGTIVLADGVVISGYVGSVRPAGGEAESRLTLAFSTVRVHDKDVRMRGTVVAVLDPRRKEDSRSSVGPMTGVPSGPAAFVNVVVNAAGNILSKNGRNVVLPIGVILRVRLDEPLVIPVK
jgi:hypothetical protein